MKSKKIIACYLLVCLLACSALASYTYVITEYQPLPSLHGNESMLVKDNGGGGSIDLNDNSLMRVEGTSPLEDGTGGIWQIGLGGYSHLEFFAGEVGTIDLATYSTATLSGGWIDNIFSYQSAYTHAGWPNPHIEVVCDVDSVSHNIGTNLLTGNWLDGSGFEIQLVDVDGYSPVFENIFFTPEPSTLLLLGAATLLMRKRR